MISYKNSLNSEINTKIVHPYKKGASSVRRVDGIFKKDSIVKPKSENKKNKIEDSSSINNNSIDNKVLLSTDVLNNNLNSNKEEVDSSMDNNRRLFLKVASVAGLGLAASTLFPKQTDAYIAGSTPASNVVGIKNIANTKINPSTEGKQDAILSELQLKANLTETQPVSIADTVNIAVNGVGNAIGINDSNGSRINPSQDDSILLLRRMVKLMESQAVVDSNMRQRIAVEAMPTTTVTLTSTTITQIAGVDSRWQIIDWSRQAYNSGIRNNLLNS